MILHDVRAAASSCHRVGASSTPNPEKRTCLCRRARPRACVRTLGVLGVWTPLEASGNSITSQLEAHAWRIGRQLRRRWTRGGEHLFTTSGDDGTNHTCAEDFGQRALSHHQMPSASVALAGCRRACGRVLTCTHPHYVCSSGFLRYWCSRTPAAAAR